MGFLSKIAKFTGAGFLGSKIIDELKPEEQAAIERPKFYEDPTFKASQEKLKGFGFGLLEGDVPDYYKSIGETGGAEFEGMLGLTKRDIQQSTAESLAKGGRARGGQLAASTARAVSDASLKARYADYNRALAGKSSLLQTGVGVTEGVRGAASGEQQQRNLFSGQDYARQVAERSYQYQRKVEEDAALGKMIGTIASVGLGVATGGASLPFTSAIQAASGAFTGGGASTLSNLGRITSQQSQTLGFDTRKYR